MVKNRPELRAALDCLGPDDLLVVKKASHLAQSMIDGLDVLNELFEGIAAGVHPQRSLILDAGRDIAEDRPRNLSWRIKAGLEAARDRGVVGGRPRVIDDDKRAVILSRGEQGESIRSIAQSLGISVGTVHSVLANAGRSRRIYPVREITTSKARRKCGQSVRLPAGRRATESAARARIESAFARMLEF